MTELLIEKGAGVNAADGRGGATLLHLACDSDHPNVEMVKLLLRLGADVNAK